MPYKVGATPRQGMTPGKGQTPLTTPSRDNLRINPDMDFDEQQEYGNFAQQNQKDLLKRGLSSLPAPRNDYEIVLPENELQQNDQHMNEMEGFIHDQADLDAMRHAEMEAKRQQELLKRSQAVQRELPRPADVNANIMRPPPGPSDPPLTELQKAEELIKKEMLTMLHHDAVYSPTDTQLGIIPGSKKAVPSQKTVVNQAHHLAYLEQNPYTEVDDRDLEQARELLRREMEVVKRGMGHGDLSLEAYTQVWEECYSQVLYLPSQNRYTRANLASKKDRIESQEKRLEVNRGHMTREAKHAAKIEKKLKILLGGYQSRAQALMKQLHDLTEQVEQTFIEKQTFSHLRQHEVGAIPKRLESLTEDVNRQTERERELQKRYDKLQRKKDMLALGVY
ncbi:cell division cycle 5-like protein [Lingula anatina]|uniref:Cell division cycle 5-like protein n=1 Tax=Lingula anatina TaxID=7574 RepID=A0A1S3HYK2_LINAN|nr:cell division cycle 5-like protein [Lingula anatina]|eukprot:XP_013391100.1 cell division cycle 5-like protein [Lingula anatina]